MSTMQSMGRGECERAAARHHPGESGGILGKMLLLIILGLVSYVGWGLGPSVSTYFSMSRATQKLVRTVANGKNRQRATRDLLREAYRETGLVLGSDAVSIKLESGRAAGTVRFALPVHVPLLDRTYRPIVSVSRSATGVGKW
jgi:hypothetical protein